MTHTEESLMALAADYGVMYAAGQQGGWNELQSAIREVLAERDRYLDIIRREAWLEHAAENDVASPYVPFTDWVAEKNRAERAEAELAFKASLVHELLPYQERALKAEAECERRNQLLGEARSYLIYAGWADLVSRIDAAIKEQP